MKAFPIQPPVQSEIRAFLHLTIPLASAQVAQAATGFIDTVMMGWLGQQTLASGGLAAATFTASLVAVTGLVTGISPLVAEAHGANNRERIRQLTRQGFWLALLVSLPMMGVLLQADRFMEWSGQSDVLVTQAQTYLDAIVWGFLPAVAFAMLKSVTSSLSEPRPVMVIVILGTGMNAIGNYVLGFGHFGFPALGLRGIALASALSHWLMLACLIGYSLRHPRLKPYRLIQLSSRLEPQVLGELLWIGLPIGVSFALEVGLFTATTYLMGLLGTEILAAHQIVFQTIAVIFMVPLGMSFATTIRVGQWNGQNNPVGVRRAAYVAMALGGGFMTLAATVLLLFPRQTIALYIDIQDPGNARVIALATSMFAIAALGQILDGVQTTAAGALRGLKDTRIPMVLSLFAFWGVGLASGYTLGFQFKLGGVGLWLGQVVGVGVSAALFIWRFHQFAYPEKGRS